MFQQMMTLLVAGVSGPATAAVHSHVKGDSPPAQGHVTMSPLGVKVSVQSH